MLLAFTHKNNEVKLIKVIKNKNTSFCDVKGSWRSNTSKKQK